MNSRPFRVRRGFSSVCMTMSTGQMENVGGLRDGRRAGSMSIMLLSSTFRRHCIGPNVGVLLMSCRHLVVCSGVLPTKELHRPLDKGDHTSVIVVAGYPGSLGPVRFHMLAGTVSLCPFRGLCFAYVSCSALGNIFAKGRLGSPGSCRILLLANVTSPGRVRRSLGPVIGRVGSLSFNSRRHFGGGSVSHVGRTFRTLPRPHVVVAARGSTIELERTRKLCRDIGRDVCRLPVGMDFVLSRRSGFGRGVVDCMQGGSEGDVLTGEGSRRGSRSYGRSKGESQAVDFEGG